MWLALVRVHVHGAGCCDSRARLNLAWSPLGPHEWPLVCVTGHTFAWPLIKLPTYLFHSSLALPSAQFWCKFWTGRAHARPDTRTAQEGSIGFPLPLYTDFPELDPELPACLYESLNWCRLMPA